MAYADPNDPRKAEAMRRYYRANTQKQKDLAKARKQKLKKMVRDLKEGTPCADCGQRFPSFVMDYDHRDSSTKFEMVSVLVGQGRGKQMILDEIDKCDLICANCHRARTHRRGYWKP